MCSSEVVEQLFFLRVIKLRNELDVFDLGKTLVKTGFFEVFLVHVVADTRHMLDSIHVFTENVEMLRQVPGSPEKKAADRDVMLLSNGNVLSARRSRWIGVIDHHTDRGRFSQKRMLRC